MKKQQEIVFVVQLCVSCAFETSTVTFYQTARRTSVQHTSSPPGAETAARSLGPSGAEDLTCYPPSPPPPHEHKHSPHTHSDQSDPPTTTKGSTATTRYRTFNNIRVSDLTSAGGRRTTAVRGRDLQPPGRHLYSCPAARVKVDSGPQAAFTGSKKLQLNTQVKLSPLCCLFILDFLSHTLPLSSLLFLFLLPSSPSQMFSSFFFSFIFILTDDGEVRPCKQKPHVKLDPTLEVKLIAGCRGKLHFPPAPSSGNTMPPPPLVHCPLD
ncbi:unnamed protein product [Pleuronectes platessa]|uniref:Uncharacterized protein n=1 Tax=Pleuronectes platessa TaxID=8262 RepID=A0A9N7UMV8_PLEPL|nr:unnamed protein product [Pleuronectes platessa]